MDGEFAYYAARSGLTPVSFYTLAEHKRAYFAAQVASGGGGGTITAPTIDGNVDGGWSTGTTATITPGAGINTGSWMIVGVAVAAGGVTITPPDGTWTALNASPGTTTGTRSFAWFAKIRAAGDGSYTFTSSVAGNKHIGIVYGSGADVVSNWVIGTAQTRATSGGTTTNTAPSVTTTVDKALVMMLSGEATSTTESAITSCSGTTQYTFMPQTNGTNIETLFFGSNVVSPAGASGAASVVYPNTQASNGLAVQVAIQPPASGGGGGGPTPVTTVAAWLALGAPYNIAHFGGDLSWPPGLSLYAYQQAALWNYNMALEVSMWQTSDGVWVVSHDNTTDTLYGTSGVLIPNVTWASIQNLKTVNGGYPIMKAADLFTALPNRIWFVDNKGSQDQSNWLNTFLPTYGGPTNFIIKTAGSAQSMPTAAHAAGYKTWGYFYDSDSATFSTQQAYYDLLGMDYTGTQANWTTLLGYGKPVIAHIVPTSTAKATALSKGANGYMASGVTVVIPQLSLTPAGGSEVDNRATFYAKPPTGVVGKTVRDNELAYWASLSGLSAGTLSDHKHAVVVKG